MRAKLLCDTVRAILIVRYPCEIPPKVSHRNNPPCVIAISWTTLLGSVGPWGKRAPRETRYPAGNLEGSPLRLLLSTRSLAAQRNSARTDRVRSTSAGLHRRTLPVWSAPCQGRAVSTAALGFLLCSLCSFTNRRDRRSERSRRLAQVSEATSRKAMLPTAQAAAAGERSADAPALCRKLLTAAAVTHQNVTRHSQRRASSRLVCLLLQSIGNISLGEFLH